MRKFGVVRTNPQIVAVAAVGWILAQSVPALAYRTISDLPDFDGAGRVTWPLGAIPVELNSEVPTGLDARAVAFEMNRSFETWATPACSNVLFDYRGTTDLPAQLGDGRNTVQFIAAGWEDLGYEAEQAGVTELDYAPGSEEGAWFIAEADLFINAEFFSWDIGPSAQRRPLASLFVHEGGHMLGLLHPCEEGGRGVPECSEQDYTASAMFPYYDATRIALDADDEAAVCFLYGDVSAPLPGRCDGDGDCSSGEQCGEEGECVASRSSDSESCTDHYACSPGFCTAASVCSKGSGDFGAQCAGSDDCRSGECLAGSTEEPVCTQECSAARQCPAHWTCTPVGARDVCVPDPSVKGGCSLVAAAQAGEPSRFVGCAWLALLAVAAWRTARRRAPKPSVDQSFREQRS